MTLVDKEIETMVNNHQLIIEGFESDNLGAVSYDVGVKKVFRTNRI